MKISPVAAETQFTAVCPYRYSMRKIIDNGIEKIMIVAAICVKLFIEECKSVTFLFSEYDVLLYTASWKYPKLMSPAVSRA